MPENESRETAPPIIGLRASAGGIEAFQAFFANMPADSGMGFAVPPRLPANRASILPDIPGRWTAMRVREVTEGCRVEANQAYAPPSGVSVEAMPGHIMAVRGAHAIAEPPAAETNALRLAFRATPHRHTGHDFSGYKEKTFLRRVRRRMRVTRLSTLDDHAARLEGGRAEGIMLFRGLLIGVTSCFLAGGDGGGYAVGTEPRALCTFSAHSLTRDPPFSRMDPISRRDMSIYLDTEARASVIPAFHYSLSPNGILLLGSSETISRHGSLFATLDKTHRIFQRRDVPGPPPGAPIREACVP